MYAGYQNLSNHNNNRGPCNSSLSAKTHQEHRTYRTSMACR